MVAYYSAGATAEPALDAGMSAQHAAEAHEPACGDAPPVADPRRWLERRRSASREPPPRSNAAWLAAADFELGAGLGARGARPAMKMRRSPAQHGVNSASVSDWATAVRVEHLLPILRICT